MRLVCDDKCIYLDNDRCTGCSRDVAGVAEEFFHLSNIQLCYIKVFLEVND